MLKALLTDASVDLRDVGTLPDDADCFAGTLRRTGRNQDLVLSAGRMSKGEEDRVRSVLAVCGGITRFPHMRVKPACR